MSEADVERDAKRMLVAIYRLSKGTPGVDVARVDLHEEIRRESLYDLSAEQFEVYRSRCVAEVKAHRAAQVSGTNKGNT